MPWRQGHQHCMLVIIKMGRRMRKRKRPNQINGIQIHRALPGVIRWLIRIKSNRCECAGVRRRFRGTCCSNAPNAGACDWRMP